MNRSPLTVLPAAALVGLLGWAALRRPSDDPVVVVLPGAPADPSGKLALPSSLDNPLDRSLAATLTADDVARGVWALATTTEGPALDAAQRAALAEPVARAAALRGEVGELRHRRRAALSAEQADWAEAARLLPPAQLAAAVGAAPRSAPVPAGAPPGSSPSPGHAPRPTPAPVGPPQAPAPAGPASAPAPVGPPPGGAP